MEVYLSTCAGTYYYCLFLIYILLSKLDYFCQVCKTTCDFGVFTHSYYIVLRQLDNVVKSQLLTYNEELLEGNHDFFHVVSETS